MEAHDVQGVKSVDHGGGPAAKRVLALKGDGGQLVVGKPVLDVGVPGALECVANGILLSTLLLVDGEGGAGKSELHARERLWGALGRMDHVILIDRIVAAELAPVVAALDKVLGAVEAGLLLGRLRCLGGWRGVRRC